MCARSLIMQYIPQQIRDIQVLCTEKLKLWQLQQFQQSWVNSILLDILRDFEELPWTEKLIFHVRMKLDYHIHQIVHYNWLLCKWFFVFQAVSESESYYNEMPLVSTERAYEVEST